MSSDAGTPRAQPFYCPYCSEQDFVPAGDEAGRYLCNSCNRHYVVRYLGLGRVAPETGDEAGTGSDGAFPAG